MSKERIQQSLKAKFDESRIVLWYDEEEEFHEMVSALVPPGVKLISLKETGPFALKVLIEIEEPNAKFLIYHPGMKKVYHPEMKKALEEDWLLDLFSTAINLRQTQPR